MLVLRNGETEAQIGWLRIMGVAGTRDGGLLYLCRDIVTITLSLSLCPDCL